MKESRAKKTPKWVIVILIFICTIVTLFPIVLVGLGIIMEIKNTTDYKLNDNGTISIDRDSLTILNGVKGYYDEKNESYYIEGYLKNNKYREYGFTNITYTIYDQHGNILGEAIATISKIEKRGIWKFKAVYSENDAKEASNFKLSDVQVLEEDFD